MRLKISVSGSSATTANPIATSTNGTNRIRMTSPRPLPGVSRSKSSSRAPSRSSRRTAQPSTMAPITSTISSPTERTVMVRSGMTAGHACDPGLTDCTPTNAHSGRDRIHIAAGPTIAAAAASADDHPRPPRRAVPQLGDEVGEGHDHERERRVVVVLEGGPVDARPRHPLGREADGRSGRAPGSGAGTPSTAAKIMRRDPEPPDDEVAGVVDGAGRVRSRTSPGRTRRA